MPIDPAAILDIESKTLIVKLIFSESSAPVSKSFVSDILPMTSLPSDIADVQPLEEMLHRPEVRRSRAALEALLADGFVEFGSSGVIYSRDVIIDRLVQEHSDGIDTIVATNYALTTISNDAVLLTYESELPQGDGTKRHVLRSSIWKRNGDRWQMLFHQGTIKRRVQDFC